MRANRKSKNCTAGVIGWSHAVLVSALALGAWTGCKHDYPAPTPIQEERQVIDTVTQSGPVPSILQKALEPRAAELWDQTFALGRENLRRYYENESALLNVGPVGCFKAGCMVQLWFRDRAAASVFEEGLLVGPRSPLRVWPGRIYRGPMLDDERRGVRTTWSLMVLPPRYDKLLALSTVRHATAAPAYPAKNTAVSDLQQGEP